MGVSKAACSAKTLNHRPKHWCVCGGVGWGRNVDVYVRMENGGGPLLKFGGWWWCGSSLCGRY